MRLREAQFATAEWYVKAVGIMALVCYLEYSSLAHGFNLLKSTVLGVLMAMIGLCIQHDANHGAVSASGDTLRTGSAGLRCCGSTTTS